MPTPEWHVRGKVAPRCKQHVIARRLHIIRSPRGRWSLFGSSTPTVRFLGVMPSLVAELTVSSAHDRGTCVANEQRGLVTRCHDCWDGVCVVAEPNEIDPVHVDNERTNRSHVGEAITDGRNYPGYLLIGLGLATLGLTLVAAGYGFRGWAVIAGCVCVISFRRRCPGNLDGTSAGQAIGRQRTSRPRGSLSDLPGRWSRSRPPKQNQRRGPDRLAPYSGDAERALRSSSK